jgi:hypothetical protein
MSKICIRRRFGGLASPRGLALILRTILRVEGLASNYFRL